MNIYADVWCEGTLQAPLQYEIPPEMQKKAIEGAWVSVLLKKQSRIGLITRMGTQKSTDKPLLPIETIIPMRKLTPLSLQFYHWISHYYMRPLSAVITKVPLLTDPISSLKTRKKREIIPPPHPDSDTPMLQQIHAPYLHKNAFIPPIFLWETVWEHALNSLRILLYRCVREKRKLLWIMPSVRYLERQKNAWEGYLPEKGCIWYHEKMTRKKRCAIWQNMGEEQTHIVISTPEGLFLPFKKLSYVILEEEQEQSYKYRGLRLAYHGQQAGLMLARMAKATTLLRTSSPSLATYMHAKKGHYACFKNPISLAPYKWIHPPVRHKKKIAIDEALREVLNQAFEQQQQCIYILPHENRAQYIVCEVCGHVPRCQTCGAVWRMEENSLYCTQCRAKQAHTLPCEDCQNTAWYYGGKAGIKEVEETLSLMFQGLSIGCIGRNTPIGKEKKLLRGFEQKTIQCLLSIPKPLYPKPWSGIMVVGQADMWWMRSGHYASQWRFYQFLRTLQVHIAQTKADVRLFVQGKREIKQWLYHGQKEDDLYTRVLQERRDFGYPPFLRAIEIHITHPTLKFCEDMAEKVLKIAEKKQIEGLQSKSVWRYIPSKRKNVYHTNIFLKLPSEAQEALKNTLQQAFKHCDGVQFIVDT